MRSLLKNVRSSLCKAADILSISKHMTAVANTTTIIFLAMCVQLLFWAFEPAPSIESTYTHPWPVVEPINSRKGLIEIRELNSGESAYLYREYCMIGSHHNSYIVRYLQDTYTGYIVKLGALPVIGDLGCVQLSFKFDVPEDIPPGEYLIHEKVFTTVNVLRNSKQELPVVRVIINNS